ncbi:hypothetical protein ONZ45_g7391 [Pleurotus djamor]|nr:hypothetical protein ONZ45_g7391 [Pleurotus djamor]
MARNPLKRLSMALKLGSSNGIVAPPKPLDIVSEASTLTEFLTSTKENYLRDINDADGNRGAWTVSMGNEAGDLDSIASSIAFAWYYSAVNKKQTVPLIQIQNDDFKLREENVYALSLAGIKDPVETLVTSSDIESFIVFPSHKFALVDHNRLGNRFSEGNSNAEVVAVIDHHEDEGLYKDANPRWINPAGSCASLVALTIRNATEVVNASSPADETDIREPSEPTPKIPAELATLLLCAILIDTGGLKRGGKATDFDYEAATYLIPNSTLKDNVPEGDLGDKLPDSPAVKELTGTLDAKKSDVSHLTALDLLRRDYKESEYQLGWAPNQPSIKVGLSTVPVGLKEWATKGKLLEASQEWMKKRDLTALGVLTSYRDDKKFGRSGKGKHRRGQVWVLRQGTEEGAIDIDLVADRLFAGLKESKELKLKKDKKFELVPKKEKLPKEMRWKGYKQGNVDASRKVTAPLVKSILEGDTTVVAAVAEGDAIAEVIVATDPAEPPQEAGDKVSGNATVEPERPSVTSASSLPYV